MSVLGLDIGQKRIGAAVSDPLGITAQGLPTIENNDNKITVSKIKIIIEEFDVDKIVVGLPKNLDGTIGKQAQYVLDFVDVLRKNISQVVETWDERFSSRGVERILLDAGVKRRKRKQELDRLSAQWILQGYLERTRNA